MTPLTIGRLMNVSQFSASLVALRRNNWFLFADSLEPLAVEIFGIGDSRSTVGQSNIHPHSCPASGSRACVGVLTKWLLDFSALKERTSESALSQ